MANEENTGCGCPPTSRAVPAIGGVHHVFLTVNDLKRSRPFYAALMPRLGFPELHDFGAVLGWAGTGGSFWLKQADPRYAGDTFSKDRVGLCEVAFRARAARRSTHWRPTSRCGAAGSSISRASIRSTFPATMRCFSLIPTGSSWSSCTYRISRVPARRPALQKKADATKKAGPAKRARLSP